MALFAFPSPLRKDLTELARTNAFVIATWKRLGVLVWKDADGFIETTVLLIVVPSMARTGKGMNVFHKMSQVLDWLAEVLPSFEVDAPSLDEGLHRLKGT